MVTMDKSEPGSIRTYLMQMGDIPLLSRSEELATARQIDKTRGRLRRGMLSSDFILHAAIAAVGEVLSGKLRLDQVIELSIQRSQEGADNSALGDELPDARSAPSLQPERFPHRRRPSEALAGRSPGRTAAASPSPSKGGVVDRGSRGANAPLAVGAGHA